MPEHEIDAAIERAAEGGGPDRIARALEFAVEYGTTDGDHHKMWVIDQMVRALSGCPMETQTAIDYKGAPYEFEAQGESNAYRALIAAACDGEDGPDTYGWDEGVAP